MLPTQAKRKISLEKVVEFRTGTVGWLPKIYWKSISGCWTNHWKGTGLHCCCCRNLLWIGCRHNCYGYFPRFKQDFILPHLKCPRMSQNIEWIFQRRSSR